MINILPELQELVQKQIVALLEYFLLSQGIIMDRFYIYN